MPAAAGTAAQDAGATATTSLKAALAADGPPAGRVEAGFSRVAPAEPTQSEEGGRPVCCAAWSRWRRERAEMARGGGEGGGGCKGGCRTACSTR